MLESWCWFGPHDRITLSQIAQTGVRGIVTALYDVPRGEVWMPDAIAAHRALIETAGLRWAVVENLPVHDRIRRGEGDLAVLFANYRTSLENLAEAGVRTICHDLAVDDPRANLGRFLDEVIPTAERCGLKLCIGAAELLHPASGVLQVAPSADDLAWVLQRAASPANGLALGTAGLGTKVAGDLLQRVRRLASRIQVVRLAAADRALPQTTHPEGNGDLARLVALLLREEARRRAEGRSDAEVSVWLGHRPPESGQVAMIEPMSALAELRGMVAATQVALFEARCTRLTSDLGLGSDVVAVTPLTGGVASDIARVDLPDGPICVKFALPKLKVAADWYAPVHRNRAEYQWLAAAAQVAPGSVPRLLGRSDTLNGFAMEFLSGNTVYLWKAALLAGAPLQDEAALVADVLGRIHAHASAPGFDAAPFQNQDDFAAIRLEPYLRHTATRHPDLAPGLLALADALYRSHITLVHGDISPKNILIRDGVPVILDAECATMGDPVFDVAFCLNHLVLKSLHLPDLAKAYLAEVHAFWQHFAAHVTWENPAGLEARLMALLPALMLARVDGKSPVEYLDAAEQVRVRDLARGLIVDPAKGLADFLARLGQGCGPDLCPSPS